MRFIRLFIVVTVVTLLGGVFGSSVGALMAIASPGMIEVVFDLDLGQANEDAQRIEDASTAQAATTRVGVSTTEHGSFLLVGTSAGAAMGLITGATFAIFIGLLDQVILLCREFLRQPANKP